MDRILEIADAERLEHGAERADAVGQMMRKVRESADPDGTFQDLARVLFSGFPQETRRLKVTMLAQAFGADRAVLKRYLRAATIVGEKD